MPDGHVVEQQLPDPMVPQMSEQHWLSAPHAVPAAEQPLVLPVPVPFEPPSEVFLVLQAAARRNAIPTIVVKALRM